MKTVKGDPRVWVACFMNRRFHPRVWGEQRGVNLKYWLRLSLFLVLLVWGQSAAAQANNIVQPVSIYVHSGPSESSIAIGALFQDESITPVNRSTDSTWILVLYGRGTGWIQREGVTWQTDLAGLPVLPPDVTPTARATQPLRLLSPTPASAQGFVLVSEGVQAIVRSGPLRGYSRVGQLSPGAMVEPVSRSAEGSWILIRYADPDTAFDGFGWIARDLVQWRDEEFIQDLPIMNESDLTPTATEDASIMLAAASPTTAPITATSPIATETSISTQTATTATTLTETLAPTVTLMLAAATETLTPSETAISASATSEPPSATPETPTLEAVAQIATDVSPTSEDNRIIAAPVTPTPTIPTETPAPTLTPPLPIEAPVEVEESNPMIPLMALAGVTVAGGLVYLGAFARAMPELRRYEQGFVRTDCPVCERGALVLEEKRSSTLGIPSVRRTVRCTACRSVLREKNPQHWTYAVDRLENPTVYERFNGREIRDDELKAL